MWDSGRTSSTGRAGFWTCLWFGALAPFAGLAVVVVAGRMVGLLAAAVCVTLFVFSMLTTDRN